MYDRSAAGIDHEEELAAAAFAQASATAAAGGGVIGLEALSGDFGRLLAERGGGGGGEASAVSMVLGGRKCFLFVVLCACG